MSSPEFRSGLILFLGLIISVGLHEFGHAVSAHLLGDPTPESQGRVTLNPLAHMDPIGTLLFPILFIFVFKTGMLFGWGKPVQINPFRFNRKFSMRTGDIIVSLAGPAMNILLALLFTIVLAVSIKTGGSISGIFAQAMMNYIILNLVLAFFNLIPLPPLDGSHILINMMGPKQQHIVDFIEQYGLFILIGIMATGFLDVLFKPVMSLGIWLIKLAVV